MISGESIPQLLVKRAETEPSALVLRFFRQGKWNEVSVKALVDRAAGIGGGLMSLGFVRGEVIAISSTDAPFLLAAEIGVQGFGGVVLPLDPDLSPEEARERLRAAGAAAVLAGDQEQFDKVDEAWSEVPQIRVLVVDAIRGLRSLTEAGRDDADRRLTLAQLEQRGSAPIWYDKVCATQASDDARVVAFGSNTQTHLGLLTQAIALQERVKIDHHDQVVLMGSIANDREHLYAIVCACFARAVLHFGRPGDAGHALRSVQPTVVVGSMGWAQALASDIDRGAGPVRGVKAIALRAANRRVESENSRLPRFPPTRIAGVSAAVAVLLFWLVTTSLHDGLRILLAGLILLVFGAALVFSGRSVAGPLRSRSGLSRCRAALVPGWESGCLPSLHALQVPFLHDDLNVMEVDR